VAAVTQERNENGRKDLGNPKTLSALVPASTYESDSADEGRKIQIHDDMKTYKRKADGQNQQNNRKRLRMQPTLHNENEAHSSGKIASKQRHTVMTGADRSPHSTLLGPEMSIADCQKSASTGSTPELLRDRDACPPIEPANFLHDLKHVDPIKMIDISQFIPAETDEISHQTRRTMVARSYQKWNPWGMKAVCGTDILQETEWDEGKKAVSEWNDGATWGENIGFAMIMH
jgi:hypothetical protein